MSPLGFAGTYGADLLDTRTFYYYCLTTLPRFGMLCAHWPSTSVRKDPEVDCFPVFSLASLLEIPSLWTSAPAK